MGMVYLDAEYNSSSEAKLNVLCFSVICDHDGHQTSHNIWVQDNAGIESMTTLVESFIAEGHTFVAFAVTAEARALLSIGIDPRRIKWIDLQLEYRVLENQNNRTRVGKHLIKGKIVTLKAPLSKWNQPEGYSTGGKVEFSLASCIYRFLGVQINTDLKNQMRDLILDNMEWDDLDQQLIQEYCMTDVVYLPALAKIMINTLWSQYLPKHRVDIKQEMYLRAHYAVLTAIMENRGYPIDEPAMRTFSGSVGSILFEMQESVNSQFPSIEPFLLNKKGTLYCQKKNKLSRWVERQGHRNWPCTKTGELSLALDAFEEFYDHRGDLQDFGNRFCKYLREKQALNGFTGNTKKKNIWDSTGKDSRVRPYYSIFGSQTSRSQPKATSFLLLKSSWMRVLIMPKKGRSLLSIDFSQQEFLLAGILSGDQNMVQAYHSGDPYFAFAKQAGAVPQGAIRADHEEIRDKFKATCLGVQFGMGAKGLSVKITKDTGQECSVEEAQRLIDLFYSTYAGYNSWRIRTLALYKSQGYLRLPCGWTMWNGNENEKSILNFPIQGCGASVLRRAVSNSDKEGLEVIMTLHDAIYIECDTSAVSQYVEILAESMQEAMSHYFKDSPMLEFTKIRMDPHAWGPDFTEGQFIKTSIGKMHCDPKYVNARGRKDYEKYRPYFTPDDLVDF